MAVSRDYLVLANSLLLPAHRGDADAQYYLWKTIRYCSIANTIFSNIGKPITLDEGLQFAVELHLSMATAQLAFDRCHEFQNPDAQQFGFASDWLAEATEGGQPVAQAVSAMYLLSNKLLNDTISPGGPPSSIRDLSTNSGQPEPRELLRMALESLDPDVLYIMGELQGTLESSSENSSNRRLGWILVACERGLDCSADADWLEFVCTDASPCDTSTPSNLIRGFAGDGWPEVQRLAQEINAYIDSGQWDLLIGS